MKRLVLLLFITVIFNGCDIFKKDVPPKHATFGSLEGTLNGEVLAKLFPPKYQAVRATIDPSTKECKDPIQISVELYNSKNDLRATLLWDNLKTIPGKFTVNRKAGICTPNHEVSASFFTIIEKDILGNRYQVLDTPDNFFELESYNDETREIRGKFNVTLLKSNGSDPLFLDTLRFTEGKIHTRLFLKDELIDQ